MENEENMPKHIAIILDGNRRWAKTKGLSAVAGHKEGAKNIEKIAKFANKIGLKYLTVYAFSTENWKRSEEEVKGLMLLLDVYVRGFLRNNLDNIKLKILGDITVLSDRLQRNINELIEKTKNNTGLTFNIAFNYGGRAEILRAVKNISKQVVDGKMKIEEITEQTISDNLYTAGQPDPDLVIRTSGEIRTSNFLPWQIVYAEYYFPQKYWPEFTEEDLLEAINVYQKRNRRFGGK